MPNDENFYAIRIQKLPAMTILIFFRAKNDSEFNYIMKMENVILMRRYLCIYNTPSLEPNYCVK